MKKEILDLYSDYLLSYFGQVTATGISRLLDGALSHDQVTRMLADDRNLVAAGTRIMEMGPKIVIIKKGEYGATLCCEEGWFGIPAYPVPLVKDPTGAGDSFAGGVMGFLASERDLSFPALKKAMVYGTLFVVWFVLGLILNRTLRGFSPELLIEIPSYRLPSWQALTTKLWMRVQQAIEKVLQSTTLQDLVDMAKNKNNLNYNI